MSTEEAELDARQLELFAGLGSIGVAFAFAFAVYLALDAPAFGAAVGLAAGVGSFLHLPYLLGRNSPLDGSRPYGPDGVAGGASGLALEAGAVVAFALAFALGPDADALVVGAAVVVLGYLVLSRVLPE